MMLVTTLIFCRFRTPNIRVLSADRSFLTAWGSWAIMRAQLECLEELARMDVAWDFAINLSGSDLPIRSMEDLALALAPHRGIYEETVSTRYEH